MTALRTNEASSFFAKHAAKIAAVLLIPAVIGWVASNLERRDPLSNRARECVAASTEVGGELGSIDSLRFLERRYVASPKPYHVFYYSAQGEGVQEVVRVKIEVGDVGSCAVTISR